MKPICPPAKSSPVAATYSRLVGNSLATLAGRVASMLLALVLSALLFRWLGPSLYGLWSFFFVLVGYSSILDLGLATTIERFVARARFHSDRTGIQDILNLALTAVICLAALLQAGFLLVPATFWSRFAEGRELARIVLVLPLCLLLTGVATVSGGGLAGIQRMGRLNAIRSGINVVRTIAVLGLAGAGVRRLDLLLLAYAAGAGAAAVACWRALEREVGSLRIRPFLSRPKGVREYLRFGFAVQSTTLSYQMGDQLLRLLIGSRFGLDWMGFYDLGTRAAFVLRSFASVLLTAMVPFGTDQHLREGRASIALLHRLSVKYVALFVLPGTALALFYSRETIILWIGASAGSEAVIHVFRIFLIGNAIAVLGGPAAMIGRSVGKPVTEGIFTAAGVAVGLIAATLALEFDLATGLYAVASFGVSVAIWFRLSAVLRLPLEGIREVLIALSCALLGLAVALAADKILELQDYFRSGWGVAIRLAIGTTFSLVTLLAAVWRARVLSPEEKNFWRQSLRLRARGVER